MGTAPFVIRNYSSADAERYIRLHAEGESVCHSRDTFVLASLTGDSPEPPRFSHEDLFLAEEETSIVGACRVVPEPAIDRAVLRLLIMPGCIERGIAAELLRSALVRAADIGPAKAHADLREEDRAARALFAGFGFRPVRRYTEMTLTLESAAIVESNHESLSLHPLETGGEEEFTRLQNRVFSGSWGFCPNTTAEIVQQLNTPGYGHDGVIAAYQGDEVIAYCWTARSRPPDRKGGAIIGRIHMMGVAPAFRGRGVGKHILRAGLNHLADKGIRTVELTVDNENEAARSLYQRAGFTPKTALVWYEKQVR